MAKIDDLINKQTGIATACMIDFDDFKGINDSYGHLTDDAILSAFSRIVQDGIDANNYVGRY